MGKKWKFVQNYSDAYWNRHSLRISSWLQLDGQEDVIWGKEVEVKYSDFHTLSFDFNFDAFMFLSIQGIVLPLDTNKFAKQTLQKKFNV